MKSQQISNGFRVGVDIGGMFTDIVFLSKEGRIRRRKISSTPDDFTRAIISGLQAIMSDGGLSGSDIVHFVHGCTVDTNTVLEHTGARIGLLTTKGFRDMLVIRPFRIPELYSYHWEKPVYETNCRSVP